MISDILKKIPSKVFFLLSFLIILGIYLFQTRTFWFYINDDAYITFRYSLNFSQGKGPYFNPGEFVEGYSNFLLMVILIPFFWVTNTEIIPFIAKGIGIFSGILCLGLVFFLGKFLAEREKDLESEASWIGVFSAALLATCPSFAVNSTSGLETLLYSFLITAGVYFTLIPWNQKNWFLPGIFFSLSILTRPEAPFIFGCFWISYFFMSWLKDKSFSNKKFWLNFLMVVGTFAFHLLFRVFIYEGEIFPNTFYAKSGGFWKIGAWDYIQKGLFDPFFGFVGMGAAFLGVARIFSFRNEIFPVSAIFVSGGVLIFIVGTDWMLGWRFVAPFLPVASVLVGIGWALIIKRLSFKPHWILALIFFSLIPLIWLHQDITREKMKRLINVRALGYKRGHMELSNWIHQNTKTGDTIALMDIGIIGYENPQLKILDFTGLTDRHVAKSQGHFLDKQFDLKYIFNQKPEFIILVCNAKRLSNNAIELHHHNPIEEKIYSHPEFKRFYMADPHNFKSKGSTLEGIARKFGSVSSFLQQDHYLLMAFKRKTPT